MSGRVCPVCRGAGNLLTTSRGLEWWTCSGCVGAGVTLLYSAPVFEVRRRRAKARLHVTSPTSEITRLSTLGDGE